VVKAFWYAMKEGSSQIRQEGDDENVIFMGEGLECLEVATAHSLYMTMKISICL